MWPFSSSYKTIVQAKRAEREAALQSAPRFDATVHGEYLSVTASEIVRRIKLGQWMAIDVLEAYIARAALAHSITNCLTEVFFETARKEARALDEEFARTGHLKGPLHGVPVSFKDQFEIAGVDATIGFTQWANKPCSTDAFLVSEYRDLGAIPFVKTNVPQTMLAFECSNPLWGVSLNPWSAHYTCGGSSGGEGALLAMDGAAMGVGSDIGGSLRIPASYCGIYSLKPGVGRFSTLGARSPTKGFESIKTVTGPMTRSLDDLELVCQSIFGRPDPYCELTPLPFREQKLPSKLRFGYYTNDGFVKASPANKRAVLETVAALRAKGHECVEIEVPLPSKAMEIFISLTAADGYKTLLSHLGPDPQESALFLVTLGPKLFSFVRSVACWALSSVIGDTMFSNIVGEARVKPVRELYTVVAQRDEYKRLFYREVWQKHELDGIVAPVQALPGLPHGGCANLAPLAAATILYNMVESPAGSVPVTRVDATLDKLTEEWDSPIGGSKLLQDALYSGKAPVYDVEKMNGLPVGIQIVGKTWEDEKVLAMMRVVDEALGPRGFGPGMWTRDKFVR
ncbi:hypothetical protein JAAARDRAFT_31250 [Jaapia argillacea MUCL 33604]|uniref:amidase n=1 Tax=Jaapia argillacea MUCL 33604 TaxID=933084 RepID=A0A067QGN8_9AGAM|nr:hypothetical protein JAAARDRAFT_31250 [Jaapia argillacea MUCL 33604]